MKKKKVIRIILIALFILACFIYVSYAEQEDFEEVPYIGDLTNTENTVSSIPEINTQQHVDVEPLEEGSHYIDVQFLDVGTADSILLDIDGKFVLVDCGNIADGPLVTQHLKDLGVDEKGLEYLVLTHPHEDHMGGAPDVINNIEIEHILMPDRMKNTKIFEKMLDAIEEKNVDVIFPDVKDEFEVNGATFTVLSCDDDAKDDNASSIVLMFSYEDFDVLLTGDATTANEKEIMTWYSFDDIEVMKLAHHGSKTGNSKKYLDAVNPECFVVSVGEINTYGLPKEEIIERAKSYNVPLYRTDECGTIICRYHDGEYEVILDGSIYDGDR